MTKTKLEDILEGIRKKFTVTFTSLNVDGKALEILAIDNMTQHIDGLLAQKAIKNPLKDLPLWAKVWPAAFVLGRYVRKLEPEGKTLLELGAGCGITSCIASRYGFASVCISDIVDDALAFASANILQNNLEHIATVRKVDIKDSRATLGNSRFDYIAASEVLYLEDLYRPLCKCLQRHLAPQGKAIFCTDIARRRPKFFKQLAKEFRITEHMVGVRSTNDAGEEERRAYGIHIVEHA